MDPQPSSTSDDTLLAALAHHSIELPSDQIAALDRYAARLWDWNTRLNLTRHTNYEKFVSRDLIDSLQLSQVLEPNERVLDVGTGGGVPGAVIAILRPDLRVSLCESVAKKANAVQSIVNEAGVNAKVFHARAETLVEKQRFDSLLIRAVAPLAKLLGWFKPHWENIGRLLVIKGPQWVEERGEARHLGSLKNLNLRKRAAYPMVGTDAESVVLEITRREASTL